MSIPCHCSLPLPHGTMGWSVVCDHGISCSYSLTFWHMQNNTVMSHLTNTLYLLVSIAQEFIIKTKPSEIYGIVIITIK